MLAPMLVIYIMCMPMGYIVGKNFVGKRVSKWEDTIDQETERSNYAFVPIATALLLPMAAILAISQILEDS